MGPDPPYRSVWTLASEHSCLVRARKRIRSGEGRVANRASLGVYTMPRRMSRMTIRTSCAFLVVLAFQSVASPSAMRRKCWPVRLGHFAGQLGSVRRLRRLPGRFGRRLQCRPGRSGDLAGQLGLIRARRGGLCGGVGWVWTHHLIADAAGGTGPTI